MGCSVADRGFVVVGPGCPVGFLSVVPSVVVRVAQWFLAFGCIVGCIVGCCVGCRVGCREAAM